VHGIVVHRNFNVNVYSATSNFALLSHIITPIKKRIIRCEGKEERMADLRNASFGSENPKR